ncbi:MAG: energy transducer TonB [Treponema sp.]|nr:energy transducer TonB [Treponema sp.]
MKCLNSCFLDASKNRWICSVVCTVFLLTGIIVFSNFHLCSLKAASEFVSDNVVSVVTVTKKTRISTEQKTVSEKIFEKEKSLSVPKKEILYEAEKTEESLTEVDEESFDKNIEDSLQSESAGEYSANPVISEEIKKAETSYKSYVLSRIAGKKQYPGIARSKGFEGKIRVKLVILPNGSVSEMSILKECEYEVLNQACLTAIKKASPFKKMNEGMKAITLTFVMDFSLN